jgi:hypothetical protein
MRRGRGEISSAGVNTKPATAILRREDEMDALSAIFENDLTAAIFCFSSAVFLLLYAASFILSRRWKGAARLSAVIRRYVISGLGAALAAMGVGFGLHSADLTMTSATGQSGPAASISPPELHRFIGTKSLRVQEFEDQTFVFSNRD